MIGLDYTTLVVLSGAAFLSVAASTIGVFAFLRGQSLMGDAVSHAMLPGIVGFFMLTHSKNPLILLGGGALAGIIGMYCVNSIEKKTNLKKDSALGIVLSVFFGFGLLLMTKIQKQPLANQAILNKFLFGSAATLLFADIRLMVAGACLLLVINYLFFRTFWMLSFDRSFMWSCGLPCIFFENILMGLLIGVILIGLQMVGVVLMSTMLIAPAAAARQWTNRVETMIVLAAIFGLSGGISGVLMSVWAVHMPTGPAIVVILSMLVIFSLLGTWLLRFYMNRRNTKRSIGGSASR